MEHVRLGRSGLKVSRLCLGTMTFGLQCDEETSVAILDRAAEAGVTFLDTADAYPLGAGFDLIGRTEEILGRWLAGRRDDYVVATKCSIPTGPLPFQGGNARRHVTSAVEASLRRLGTDYIDLYQLHRYDPDTPVEETRRRLTTSCGRARCATSAARTGSPTRWHARWVEARRAGSSASPRCSRGTTSCSASSSASCSRCAWRRAWVSSPTTRSPRGCSRASTTPSASRPRHPLHAHGAGGNHVPGALLERARLRGRVRDRGIAERAGLAMPTLAVAWVLAHPAVTSPLVGASHPEQLEATLAAAEVRLDEAVLSELDDVTRQFRRGDAPR